MTDEVRSLKQHILELEELHRLAESLNSVVSVYETLEAVVECCLKLCKAERGAILLFSSDRDEVVQTIVRSSSSSEAEIDHVVNSLIAGWIAHHKKPFLADDLVKELNIRKPSENVRHLGSALATPLVVQGNTIGIINLVNVRGGSKFSEDSLRILSGIAPLAAQAIHRAKMQESLSHDNARLRNALVQQQSADLLLGTSAAIKIVREKIVLVAPSSANVLLVGETGTGKELVARSIHLQGPRAEKPFIPVNCAAIPATLFESELFGHEKGAFTGATEMRKGKFEQAHDGTLFLDEISALPIELQPKLLRVLEELSFSRVGSSVPVNVDVRVITASNKDLQKAVRAGEFREDLYHRLNVVPLYLPPLHERAEDIPILAQAFLDDCSDKAKSFTADALQLLSRLEWRGNVRELRNIVERISIFISLSKITASHLQSLGIGSDTQPSTELRQVLHALIRTNISNADLFEALEKQLVELALKETHGNISKAAQLLGIDRNALHRRVEKFGLEIKES